MPDPALILGCPTQVIPKMGRAIHFPAGYAALGTKEWSAPGGNGEAGEVISGYSLTAEKCTVHEPGQPGSEAVCTFSLQAGVSQSSVYPLCLPLMHESRSLAVISRSHITLQHSKE